ncbi:kinase-like protein [Thozetella sp. PMI_491]|nr:kinase-like protein [Thozetella sp. PMI_491]
MTDMVAASPTPMGAGSHFTSLGRRTSARQALRRPTSRPQLSRSESQPVANSAAVPAGRDAKAQSQSQQQQYNGESSDDEIFVPMKLSAYTKALLGDGHPEAANPAAPAGRPVSPPARPPSRVTRRGALNTSMSSAADEREPGREGVRTRETRRHARAGSVQLPSSRPTSPAPAPAVAPTQSRENSPAPRKRVVRLSGSVRRSVSASVQRKGPESRDRSDERNQPPPQPSAPEPESQQEPQQQGPADINTPVLPIRTVRIAVGSSGQKPRSAGSSSLASKRSGTQSDQEMPEAPATAGRPQPGTNPGSVSRYTADKKEESAPPSSLRMKRATTKVQGTFLRGPARRGRRRQSEEDAEEQGEGEPIGSSQEPESLLPPDGEQEIAGHPASSFFASSYREPDFVAQGSPVGGKDSARAIRNKAAKASSPVQPVPELLKSREPPVYKLPAPQLPSAHDKENEVLIPLALKGSSIMGDRDVIKPVRPMSINPAPVVSQSAQRSPERKALAPKAQNTPHRAAPLPPPKMSVVETATAAAGATAVQANKKRQILLRVNGRVYTRIDCLGRGGSSKVYRVAAESGNMLALKRVALENADEHTVKGFKGEIDLLKRLRGLDRVIQLIDYEMNDEKQMLSVLMEAGELDFNTLLKSRQSTPEGAKLDTVFIRHYWKEMLECVQQVHTRDVVHSDLKPANFVLVKGRLKLIDFGIANAIQTDMTVNVHRETQIGTPSYMSPESLMDSNQYAFTSAHNGRFCVPPPLQPPKGTPKIMKLGKPSDVWTLGCILYQMVYGTTPFGKIANQMSRCQAIINWNYPIDFPETTEDGSRVPPSIMRTMKRCLNREQKERPTCDDLLSENDPFLYPQEFEASILASNPEKVLPMTEELLARVIQSVVQRCKDRMPTDAEAMAAWPSAYWASLKKATAPAHR